MKKILTLIAFALIYQINIVHAISTDIQVYFVNNDIRDKIEDVNKLSANLSSIINLNMKERSNVYTVINVHDEKNWILLHVVANNNDDSDSHTFNNLPEQLYVEKNSLNVLNVTNLENLDKHLDKSKVSKINKLLGKEFINSNTGELRAASGSQFDFKLPWYKESGNWWLNGEWHAAGNPFYPSSQNFALDFSPYVHSSIMDQRDYTILSPTDLHVVSLCKDSYHQSYITLRDSRSRYYRMAHIDARTINFNQGDLLEQGTEMGVMFKDNSNQDGWNVGNSTAGRCAWSMGTHIHVGLPSKPFITDEGYVFSASLADLQDRRSLISSQTRQTEEPDESPVPSELISPSNNALISREQEFRIDFGENLSETRLVISGRTNYYNRAVTSSSVTVEIDRDSNEAEDINVYLISKTLKDELITKEYRFKIEETTENITESTITLKQNNSIDSSEETFIINGPTNVKHYGVRVYRTSPFRNYYSRWVIPEGEVSINNLPTDGDRVKVALVTYFEDHTHQTDYFYFNTENNAVVEEQPSDTVKQARSLVNLNVRQQPSISSRIVDRLYVGEVVEVTDTRTYTNSTWYKIETTDGNTGWIAARYYRFTLAVLVD